MFKLRNVFMEEAGTEDKSAAAATAKTYTEAEVAELVSGLKTNNEKLLAEKKEAKRIAEENAAAKLQSDQEAAKNSGKLEEFEKSLRKQYDPLLAEKDALLAKRSERILLAERKSTIGDVLAKGKFEDAEASDILATFVKVEFDGDDVITKFVGADGNVITTDVDKFVEYCSKHPVFSKLMGATASTGGGAGGNKNPNGGAGGVDPIQQKLNAKYGKRG